MVAAKLAKSLERVGNQLCSGAGYGFVGTIAAPKVPVA